MQRADVHEIDGRADSTSVSAHLERYLPNPASSTRQEIAVEADSDATFTAIQTTDVSSQPLLMALSWLRMLPDRVLRRFRGLPPPPQLEEVTIPGLIRSGFWVVLEDAEPERLVLSRLITKTRTEPTDEWARRRGESQARAGDY